MAKLLASNVGADPLDFGIEVRVIGKKGRGLVAARNFDKGAIVFSEAPLASCQFTYNKEYGYLACDHCLSPLETVEQCIQRLCKGKHVTLKNTEFCQTIPNRHTACRCGVKYCSEECMTVAGDQYHNVLCCLPGEAKFDQLSLLRQAWMNVHYPPETATILLILRIYAYYHQSCDKEVVLRVFEEFVCNTVNISDNIFHKMLGEQFQNVIASLRELLLITAQHFGLDIPDAWKSEQGFLSMLALVGLNSQGIGTSALNRWISAVEGGALSSAEREEFDNSVSSMYEILEEEVGIEFLDNEGSGLFLLQSKINHSCVPNVEVFFPHGNHILAVRTLQPIQAGDELCSSYLDPCTLNRSRHSRQTFLRDNYLFQCVCTKCEEQSSDPDVTSDEEEEGDEDMSE